MRNIKRTTSTIVIAAMLLASCGGGGATKAVTAPQPPTPQPTTAVFQTPQQENLTVADVQRNATGKSILDVIPALRGWSDHDAARLVTVESPNGPAACPRRWRCRIMNF